VIGPGVPLTLARRRSTRVREVRYALDLHIRADAPVIAGHLILRFNLAETARARPLALDYRPPRGPAQGALRELRVNGTPVASPALADEHLLLPGTLLQGGANIVEVAFDAPTTAAGTAITRVTDPADGTDYLYTLFVPSDASTVFPCFDQPDLKARFTLAATLPHDWSLVTNAPLASRRRTGAETALRFDATPPISTYLFAFAAGPFVRIGDRRGPTCTALYARRSVAAEARRAARTLFRLSRNAIRTLVDYTAHPFPFAKYDLVLLPLFPYGGMEHAGATFLREDAMLLPAGSTGAALRRRAHLVFHETAHQWFGDLVTMRWFDDLWLKEGFATFLAAKCMAREFGAGAAWNAFRANRNLALATDVTAGTTPLRLPLPNLAEAKAAYGTMVYCKGPAILQQAEDILGAGPFRDAVRALVQRHAWRCFDSGDLVATLERASGRSLRGWARAWIDGSGVPLVRVHRGPLPTDDFFSLEQSDPQGLARHRPLVFDIGCGFARGRGPAIRVEMAGRKLRCHLPGTMAQTRYLLPDSGTRAYGIFLPDAQSVDDLAGRVDTFRSPVSRAGIRDALWHAVREGTFDPARYVDAIETGLATESDDTALADIVQRLQHVLLRYLPPDRGRRIARRIEAALAKGILDRRDPSRCRVLFGGLVAIARSTAARDLLAGLADAGSAAHRAWATHRVRFDAAAALVACGDRRGPRLLRGTLDMAPSDARARLAFAARAARPDARAKRRVLDAILSTPDLPERWIEDALPYLNDLRHVAHTAPLLPQALAALPALAVRYRIFFANRWIESFIGGQTSADAVRLARQFIRRRNIPATVTRKVLESLDDLERTVRIRAAALGGD
jgi:aminopeptidase N